MAYAFKNQAHHIIAEWLALLDMLFEMFYGNTLSLFTPLFSMIKTDLECHFDLVVAKNVATPKQVFASCKTPIMAS